MKTFYKNARTNKDEDFDEDDIAALLTKPKLYKHYEQTFTAKQTHFYISEEIGLPSEYIDMIHIIHTADTSDTIFIHLNTPGGVLDTGIQIINAMKNSQATIVTVLEGMAHSLGTLIFLSGEEMVVNDNCMMMFHNFRGGVIGKGNELTSELDATIKWFAALAKKIYVPFLSEEELKAIIKGEDIWMDSKEITKRLNRMEKDFLDEEDNKKAKKTARKTKDVEEEPEIETTPKPRKSRKTPQKTTE